MEYCYAIPGKAITKKNSLQMVRSKATGRWFPIPSKAYKKYDALAAQHLKPLAPRPLCCPVSVAVEYYMPLNKDSTVTKRPPDLTNLLEATDDLLVKYGVLEDDNALIVCSHDGSRVIFAAGEPKTVIRITEV